MPGQTFHKDERLCSRKLIEQVALKGNSVVHYPFRLKWIKVELKTKYPAQVTITVPKKTFRRAVDRNRIKRLMREVYRKNKSIIYDVLAKNNVQCALLLGYMGRKIPEYSEVEKELAITLQCFEKDFVARSG